MAIKEKAPPRLRHEVKYLLGEGEARALGERLGKLFPRDRHSGPDGTYEVNSLYFDTPYDQALAQKLAGAQLREKFRIRYYGREPAALRLEKKLKANGLCAKYAAGLSLAEAERLLRGEDAFLLAREEPVLLELYSKLRGKLLRPVTAVRYCRQAFVYPPGNVRVTIDSRLCACAPERFLRGDAPRMAMDAGMAVLEVKYDAYLPDIVRLAVQAPGRQAAAFSKYAVSRRLD